MPSSCKSVTCEGHSTGHAGSAGGFDGNMGFPIGNSWGNKPRETWTSERILRTTMGDFPADVYIYATLYAT